MRRSGPARRGRARLVFFLFAPLFLAAAVPRLVSSAGADASVETGTFTLFKFQQPIGEERYEIRTGEQGTTLTSTFRLVDRGTAVALSTTLKLEASGAPVHFLIEGRTARLSAIDTEVSIGGGMATVREGGDSRREAAPGGVFTLAGYAPPSMQMQLVRHWIARGRPASIPLLPRGTARLERRGRDVFSVGGREVALDRYSVTGVIWGRESIWCDEDGRLAALVGVDAEFDHFEAVRPELADAVPELVARAAADGMAAMAEAAAAQMPSSGRVIAVVGGTILDMTGGPPIANGTVIVSDGRIQAVGPAATAAVPSGATVVDAARRFIMPGLWDMHAHVEQVEWGPIYLAAGVTTARDVGNELEFIRSVREGVAAGRGLGPRLLLAGVIDGDGPLALGVVRASTPEEGRRQVRRYHGARFQQIKIYSSIKPDVLRAIAQEARLLGMTVTGHVPIGMGTLEAVEAGLDQIDHLDYIAPAVLTDPERVLAALRRHGTVVDPTLALFELLHRSFDTPIATFEPGILKVAPELAGPLGGFGLEPEAASRQRAEDENDLAVVATLHRAGVPIVAGTDQAVPGHSLHREIELYVKAGLSPLEALQAATIVPARVMKLGGESGTIERGKRADLLILDANPLEDIRNTRRIYRVIAAGRVFDPAPLWRSVGFRP